MTDITSCFLSGDKDVKTLESRRGNAISIKYKQYSDIFYLKKNKWLIFSEATKIKYNETAILSSGGAVAVNNNNNNNKIKK